MSKLKITISFLFVMIGVLNVVAQNKLPLEKWSTAKQALASVSP